MHIFGRRFSGGSAQAGFTLMELLIACSIIGLGLVAVSAGFGIGLEGIEAGRQQSTAVFLAEQRIEQAKELAIKQPDLGAVTHANLGATEAYASIAGAPRYRRTTRICPGDAGCVALGVPGVLVTVNVFYRPVTGFGVLTSERSVSLDLYLTVR
ncbi:MAG: type IV pilus modification PilV family protein [Candidatus Rokuibacteriota bacterium]